MNELTSASLKTATEKLNTNRAAGRTALSLEGNAIGEKTENLRLIKFFTTKDMGFTMPNKRANLLLMSFNSSIVRFSSFNKEGRKCPACNAHDKPKGGILKKKKGEYKDFLGCSRFPDCKFTAPLFIRHKDRSKETT